MKSKLLATYTTQIKKLLPSLMMLVSASNLIGCNTEEKSYEHYAMHPEELVNDYKYCETHPGAGVCMNIVQKYFQYQSNYTHEGKKTTLHKDAIFRDLDQPIVSLNATTKSSNR